MVGGTTFFVLCCLSVICPSSIHFQIYSYILLCNNMMCHSFIWQTVVDREKIVSSCKVISSQYYNLSHGNNYGKSKCNLRLKHKALTTKCLQYDMTMTLIDELQQANLWIFKLFFVIGDILVCKSIIKFIISLAPLF